MTRLVATWATLGHGVLHRVLPGDLTLCGRRLRPGRLMHQRVPPDELHEAVPVYRPCDLCDRVQLALLRRGDDGAQGALPLGP